MKFKFGTKAETLEELKKHLKNAFFPEQFFFNLEDWNTNQEKIISNILLKYSNKLLAIRSSGVYEDIKTQSLAGVYESEINIPTKSSEIKKAIKKVIKSYGEYNKLNQILIQPMVENVDISGVILSYDLSTGAPYITINYDDLTGKTDTVTSGADSKCIYIHRFGKRSLISERFKKLLKIFHKIESITKLKKLDIEFCIDSNNRVIILQVRRLVADEISFLQKKKHSDYIKKINKQVIKLAYEKSKSLNPNFMLGEMPDWNPAEIIGTNPNILASSLYQYLITDKVWSISRSKIGYKNVNKPLMIMIGNHPYINVRLSLNSFLPKNVKSNIANKIIKEQINYLKENPHLHDKLEFEVAITSWDFDLNRRLNRLKKKSLSSKEVNDFEKAVFKLTYNIINSHALRIDKLVGKVRKLESIIEKHKKSSSISEIFNILDNTKKYGTIPFSILARQAFISVAILKSLVKKDIIEEADYNNFLNSIHSVSTDFINDFSNFYRKKITKKDFVALYGHLRPGTYDIRVPRYDENLDFYLPDKEVKPIKHKKFILSRVKKNKLDRLLKKSKLFHNSEEFFKYASDSITAREYAKFEFSKGISLALKKIEEHFLKKGIKKEFAAFLNIFNLKKNNYKYERNILLNKIKKNMDYVNLSRLVRLPSIITSHHDVNVIRVPFAKPTFITNKIVSGKPLVLKQIKNSSNLLKKIIVIESADPGYDWIFSHGIKGLITKYGGANSHMAIRCAEFNIPAAIGCGNRLYDAILKAHSIDIDCNS